MKSKSGRSSPSSCSSLKTFVALPDIYSMSIQSSKCRRSLAPSFLPSVKGTYYAVFFSPNAAAFPDLSLGVVATSVAREKSIISLNDSNSEKLSNKSISGSSISSLRVCNYSRKVSIEKPSTVSSNFFVMWFSI